MIRTGILGGTFDPFHYGHLHIGKAALDMYSLDELWFMPNGHPPHKDPDSITANVEERLAMLERVICREEHFFLCRYEAERPQTSFSYETMECFRAIYPERKFYFIIGGDSLDMLRTWKHPERLLACCTILVAARNEKSFAQTQRQIDLLDREFQADVRLLPVPEFPVSSSALRRAIKDGADDTYLQQYLPKDVLDYIRKKRLYQCVSPEAKGDIKLL